MNHLKNVTLSFGLVMVIMFGCQSDQSGLITENQVPATTEESSLLAEQTFNDINSFTDSFFGTTGLKSQSIEICPAITFNLATIPFSLTLDWGTGCTGIDGTTRKGKITVSLTGQMNVENSAATFSFVNFYSEGYKITGVHRITYKGFNPGTTNPRYSVFTEAKIEYPNLKFMTYRAEYWRILAEGASTATLEDDVWRIEGSSTGTTAEGLSWSAKVNSALVKSAKCKWFSKGIMLITPKEQAEIKADFGDGTCDNKVSITKEGKTTIIEIK